MNTLLLTLDEWDLCLDQAGNWALAADPYSIAQDCASAIKTVLAECYYNTLIGINYFNLILGKNPPLQLIKSNFNAAALTVPQVTSAVTFITSFQNRTIAGQVLISFTTSETVAGPVGAGLISLFFVGDNGGVLTFVGSQGGVVEFVGLI